jgi:mono/diheme cytochrome c family protein
MTRSLVSFLLVSSLLTAGCGSARRGEPLVGPREITDPVLLLGQQVFDTYCHQCHPGGTSGVGPAINNKPLPGWLIKFQVRNGLGVMPSFSSEQIPPAELDAVVRYLKELRRQGD